LTGSRLIATAYRHMKEGAALTCLGREGTDIVWDFLAAEAGPFVAAAVRAFGAEVLATEEADRPVASGREVAGRQLLRLFFGTQHDRRPLPAPLADVIAIRTANSPWPS
jgi:hypothetical protein